MSGTNNDGGQQVNVEAIVKQAAATAVAEALKGVPAIVADQIKPLADNQKILADTLAKLPPAQPEAGKGGKTEGGEGKPLSADEVKAIVGDALKSYQSSAQQTAQRNDYLGTKLKDLPPAYRNQLGEDPAKWAEQEQQIRQQFKDDLKAAGVKVPDVGGGNPGGKPPGGQVDLTKLPEGQLRDLAIKALPQVVRPDSQPQQPQQQQ